MLEQYPHIFIKRLSLLTISLYNIFSLIIVSTNSTFTYTLLLCVCNSLSKTLVNPKTFSELLLFANAFVSTKIEFICGPSSHLANCIVCNIYFIIRISGLVAGIKSNIGGIAGATAYRTPIGYVANATSIYDVALVILLQLTLKLI